MHRNAHAFQEFYTDFIWTIDWKGAVRQVAVGYNSAKHLNARVTVPP